MKFVCCKKWVNIGSNKTSPFSSGRLLFISFCCRGYFCCQRVKQNRLNCCASPLFLRPREGSSVRCDQSNRNVTHRRGFIFSHNGVSRSMIDVTKKEIYASLSGNRIMLINSTVVLWRAVILFRFDLTLVNYVNRIGTFKSLYIIILRVAHFSNFAAHLSVVSWMMPWWLLCAACNKNTLHKILMFIYDGG